MPSTTMTTLVSATDTRKVHNWRMSSMLSKRKSRTLSVLSRKKSVKDVDDQETRRKNCDSEDEKFEEIMESLHLPPDKLCHVRSKIVEIKSRIRHLHTRTILHCEPAAEIIRQLRKAQQVPLADALTENNCMKLLGFLSLTEVILRTVPSNQYLRNFLELNGVSVLVGLLTRIQGILAEPQPNVTNTITDLILEHEVSCLRCLKAIIDSKICPEQVFDSSNVMSTVVKSFNRDFPRTKLYTIQVLTSAARVPDGHPKVLEAISTSLTVKLDQYKYRPIIDALLSTSSHRNLKFSCLELLNTLLEGARSMDMRVMLQNEIDLSGFSIRTMEESLEGEACPRMAKQIESWKSLHIDISDSLLELYKLRNLSQELRLEVNRLKEGATMIEAENKKLIFEKKTLEKQLQEYLMKTFTLQDELERSKRAEAPTSLSPNVQVENLLSVQDAVKVLQNQNRLYNPVSPRCNSNSSVNSPILGHTSPGNPDIIEAADHEPTPGSDVNNQSVKSEKTPIGLVLPVCNSRPPSQTSEMESVPPSSTSAVDLESSRGLTEMVAVDSPLSPVLSRKELPSDESSTKNLQQETRRTKQEMDVVSLGLAIPSPNPGDVPHRILAPELGPTLPPSPPPEIILAPPPPTLPSSIPPPPPPVIPGLAPPPPALPGAVPPPPALPGAVPPPPALPGSVPPPPNIPGVSSPPAPHAPGSSADPYSHLDPVAKEILGKSKGTKSRLPVLNWSSVLKVPPVSVFSKVDGSLLRCLDFDEMEKIFKLATHKSPVSVPSNEVVSPNKDTPVVLDANRMRNLVVVRRRLRKSPTDILKALHDYDPSAFTTEEIELLQKIIPSSDEMALLSRTPENTLSESEAFLVKISSVDRFETRLQVLTFLKTFEDNIAEILPKVRTVLKASQSVQRSKKLEKLMQIILACGNYLNSGRRGYSEGFKLDTLGKLEDTKSSVGSISLLLYIVEFVKKTCPEVGRFYDELDLASPVQVNIQLLSGEILALRKGMDLLKIECDFNPNNTKLNEAFQDSKTKIQNIMELFNEMETAFRTVCIMYCEDPRSTEPLEFFGHFTRFTERFKKVSSVANATQFRRAATLIPQVTL